jgi:threonine dehydratase
VLRTPLRASSWLSSRLAREVLVKLECVQPTFSYKIRGAFNAVGRIAETAGASTPLVTASAGNHGRAMAHAARAFGIGLTVYVPRHAPRTKLDAIRQSGARIVLCADYDEAERRAKEHAADGASLFISPYAHPDVIAGAGTVGLEILDERPDVALILAGIGGGGLISGIALAARETTGRASVVGVEVEASCPFTRSLAARAIVTIDVKPTLADGLAGNLDPDTPTFDLVREFVDRVVTVTEENLRSAVAGLAVHERLIVEGAGAAATAALLSGAIESDGPIAVVISGANIDLDLFARIITANASDSRLTTPADD